MAGTLTVNPKPATITAHDANKTYGEADPTFTATVTGAVNGETIAYTLSRTTGENVGTYEITVIPGDNPNYQLTSYNAEFTIQSRPITVSVQNRTVNFNGSEQFGNTLYTFSNLLAGHTATITYAPSKGTLVGTYDNGSYDNASLSVTNGSEDMTDNYNLTTATIGILTIEPATDPSILTVRANSSTNNVYDGTVKSAVGFETLVFVVNGETYTVSGLTTSDPSSANVGTLVNKITGTAVVKDAQDNIVTSQFTVNTVNGTLDIAPRPITVKADNKTKVYDNNTATDPELTAAVTGAIVGDVINYTVSRVAGQTVGEYAISVVAGENPNYTVATTSGIFAITKRDATVIADNLGKTYGSADPTLTATVTGTVGTETLNHTLFRDAGNTVGTYPITVTLGENPNYQVTPTNGIFIIDKKTATVTADNNSKIYGSADPELTATVEDVVEGDTLNFTLVRVEGENVGTYSITVDLGTNPNYEVIRGNGVFTIEKKAVTVVANNNSKIYGSADPELTASVTGTLGSDVINYTLSRSAGEIVGTYPITVTPGTNPNYEVNSVSGTFTINKKPAKVVADNKSKAYGNADPVLTATVSGTVGSDALNYTLSREAGENVGPYPITVTLGENPNYQVTPTSGTLTITPVSAMVMANNKEKVYGAADPELTATIAGLKNGDPESVITYSISREDGEDVGTYIITPVGVAKQGNYQVFYLPGELIIVEVSHPCVGVTYQGHDYDAVRIGSQCWFTEDLRIPVGDHHYYKDDPAYFEKFGYLYSWFTAVGVNEGDIDTLPPTLTADDGTPYVQGICPAGWAVPSMADIAELNTTPGSTSLLKDPSTEYWLPGLEGVAGGTGFNARGGGRYNAALDRYEDLMTGYHFWAADATPGTVTILSACVAYFCDTIILTDPNQKNDRKSVRCIRKVAP